MKFLLVNKFIKKSLNIKKRNFNNKKITQTYRIFIFNIITTNIIIIFLISPIFSRKFESYYSELILKIEGSGYQNLFNSTFLFYPDEIYIKEKKIENSENFRVFLNDSENIITLKWTKQITSCKNMFSGISNILEIDFSKFDTSKVTEMQEMFKDCSSLTTLDLSNFNTKLVNGMNFMFENCKLLSSLDLSSFDTSSVTLMSGLFKNCYSLEFLNLKSFNTSLNGNMMYFFYNCYSLTSLDLSNFDTSLVTYMFEMFYNCNKLVYLDLSSFNTSLVSHMHYMFYNCTSLKSLNITNFNTSNVVHMYSMFYNCISLTSLDLSKFDTSNVKLMYNLFNGCSSLTSIDLSYFDTSNVERMDYMFNDCISLTSLDLSNFITDNVNKMKKMFYNCKNLVFLNFKNLNQEKCKEDIETIFKGIPENLVYCIDNINNNNEINDILNNKTCSINDCTNNWVENYINTGLYKYKYSYENNCYESCPEGTYTDKSIYICEFCDAKNFFSNLCNINFKKNIKKENIIKNIIKEIKNGSLDNLISNMLKNKQDLIIKNNDTVYQISTLSNQISNSKENNNISSINFGKCEKILKTRYNIGENEELILFKIEYYLVGLNIPIIEYQVFSNDENKITLNLDYCKDINVDYYIPVNIDENNIYKYNSSSEYYNDNCFPYSTENGIDLTLYDRKNDYNSKNLSLCENNCLFKEYNSDSKIVRCECPIKTEFKVISDIIIDQDSFLNNFINLEQITNFAVISCYDLLFTSEGLKCNIGSYILLGIILLSIIIIFLFYARGYDSLNRKIQNIIDMKFKQKTNKNNSNKEIKSNINLEGIVIHRKNRKNKTNRINLNYPPYKKRSNKKHKTFNLNSSSKNYIDLKNMKILKGLPILENNSSNKITIKINKNKNKIINYNDFEMNSLNYEDALNYDKRTYFQYYISLVKTNHLIIFPFFLKNDYNSREAKICFFLFSFALYYTVNAFFFTDSTMHKIYEDKGMYNIFYHLPHLIYSSLFSILIKRIVITFCFSEKKIVEIRGEKTLESSILKKKEIIKCLTKKFIFFYLLDFIFLIFFWYYLSCFCALYKNTQICLLKNTIIGFIILLLYPFGYYFIPPIFRLLALKDKKRNKECMFKFSKALQLI